MPAKPKKTFTAESYVQKQTNSKKYQFVKRIPKEHQAAFGKAVYVKSLGTEVYSIAVRKAEEELANLNLRIERSRNPFFVDLEAPRVEGSYEDFETDANFALYSLMAIKRFVATTSGNDLMLFYQKLNADERGEFNRFNHQNDILISEANPQYDHYLSEFKRLFQHEMIVAETTRRTSELKAIRTPKQFEKKFLKATDEKLGTPMPFISSVYQEYVASLTIDNDERKRYDNVVQCFIDFVGDQPINYVKKAQARAFIEMLPRYPVIRTDKMAKMKFQDLIVWAERNLPDRKTIAVRTAKVWHGKISRLFDYAVLTYDDDFDIKNPMSAMGKLVKGAASVVKRNFLPDELETIFNPAFFEAERDQHFWLPICGLFLGCRLSEIADQPLSAIKQEPKTGVWYIDVVEGKTVDSVRRIVIPTAIESAFMAYVQGLQDKHEKWLFPKFPRSGRVIGGVLRPSKPPSANYSQSFGRVLDDLGLSDSALGYHSFRHSWISAATKARVVKGYRIAIVGHAAEDVHEDTYTHHDLVDLKAEMDRVVFDGFDYARLASVRPS
jgi:integrase